MFATACSNPAATKPAIGSTSMIRRWAGRRLESAEENHAHAARAASEVLPADRAAGATRLVVCDLSAAPHLDLAARVKHGRVAPRPRRGRPTA
ncbi:hypothetical protein DFH01_23305 [Falsiroseomonas bella]|uniref:Uncharacterized protein n=1 Tax=Falsiroseomonas bella TaxID=2184016 RepID=A0A317F853_9PROT|nr:hypothetical protein [Falsiroseomonas bella]PWS35234.1 hypothetical protein DFH01_23305 [Falsiroseomonas bella]